MFRALGLGTGFEVEERRIMGKRNWNMKWKLAYIEVYCNVKAFSIDYQYHGPRLLAYLELHKTSLHGNFHVLFHFILHY